MRVRAAAACGLVVVAASGLSGCGEGAPRRPVCDGGRFDRGAWKSERRFERGASSDGRTIRQVLADRLVACGTLEGRRRAEVRRMLGSPTERVGRALYYDLGPERASIGLSDDEYLRITFSGGGRVGQTTVLE